MQTFVVELSSPIKREDFIAAWNLQKEPFSPLVDFEFEESKVRIAIHSGPITPWNPDNFRQAFQMAVRRVDPKCQVRWN